MALRIRHIATRFALLLASAAVAPLLVYGFVSLLSLQRGTRDSVITGNENVATRAAEEIRRYVTTNAQMLKALAANLQETGLQTWQQERSLKNYILRFREFRELALLDETGAVIASSSVGAPAPQMPTTPSLLIDGVAMSPIRLDKDRLPTAVFGIHLARESGWLIGEISLEEMWRMVDRIRIGGHGFALVVAPDGTLVAHGDPDQKALVALSSNMAGHPLVRAVRAANGAGPVSSEYMDGGVRKLGVATGVPPLGWTVIVEQPTAEAYANATQLATTALRGDFSGAPRHAHDWPGVRAIVHLADSHAATRDAGGGRPANSRRAWTSGPATSSRSSATRSTRWPIDSSSCRRRSSCRSVRPQSAASPRAWSTISPIRSRTWATTLRLLTRDDIDAESRLSSRTTIERELETLKRFMDDLRHVVKPRPVERFLLDVNGSLVEVVEAMRYEGVRVGVSVEACYAAAPLVIEGDRFALARVYRNLMINAIQATQPGGRRRRLNGARGGPGGDRRHRHGLWHCARAPA